MKQTTISKLRKTLLTAMVTLIAAVIAAFAQAGDAASGTDGIIPFLNQTIVWSRQLSAQQQLVNEPSDALFLNDNRQIADQVVKLSFDFARARAQALAAQPNGANGMQTQAPSQYQRLASAAAQADQKVKDSEQELDRLRQQLAAAPSSKRRSLQAAIDEVESEQELFQARRDTMRNMLQFATGTSSGGAASGSLISQIEELARTVSAANAPESDTAASQSKAAASQTAAAARDRRETPNGILPLATDLFTLRRKLDALDQNLRQTDQLAQAAKGLRAPIVAKVKELTQKGDDLVAQPDSQDPKVLAQQRKDLDALTAQFKQLSASMLPLSKQSILLDVYKRSTINWRSAVESESEAEWKGLLVRLLGLAFILGAVLGISELWRRATFKYITDARRRYQFLLIRRIVLWCLIAIIVATAFASELGAITTFAGLLTAGIAVALQNVILSVAGYFFLIGKYGVRAGDRVQIAGVTGEVVDVGLVRLQIMEMGAGLSPRPTGRVVAFSNAVVFQAGSGMFKQIPGTNFLWHEITLTLDNKGDYRQVEQRVIEIVNSVYAEYKDRMEAQRRSVERSLNSTLGAFAPESRVHLTQTSVEVVIRYPVELSSAAEIDDRITRELLDAIERDSKLRRQISGGPTLKVEEEPAEAAKA
ncbi:MAG TPA: mechanosensitive ion channel domain-containing protein [Candidatus Angelobacter sp.]|nr:mechanosensitive ion channel domain-containing protein [Candidatus Angelobacter sp.]